MIVYVCQAYSKYEQVPRDAYDEHEAYQIAINTYYDLIKMGFEVFSPIMYTHPFHVAMKCPPLDYVAHDLQLLEGFMKHDTCCSKCSKCIDTIPDKYGYYLLIDRDSECAEETCDGYSHKCEEFMGNKYDSGVVCVFAEDCLTRGYHIEPMTQAEWDQKWFVDEKKSKGAKAEYDFAHAHHIKCIRLTELLEIYQEAKERYSLKQPTSRDDILKRIIEECEPF